MSRKCLNAGIIAACFSVLSIAPCVANTVDSKSETGIASYYGGDWQDKRTANGELFDPAELTAAHPTLPLGTWVKVTNLLNGRSVNVRINDRNSPDTGRLIDLSRGAAKAVGMLNAGLARVRIERIVPPLHHITLREPPHKPEYRRAA